MNVDKITMFFARIMVKAIPLKTFNNSHQKFKNKTEQDQLQVYNYFMYIILGFLIKGTLLLGTSLVLKSVIPTLIISITFASLRYFAGGFHMKNFSSCMMLSIFMFVSVATVIQYTYLYWNDLSIFLLLSFTFIFSIYTILKYVPKDHPNKRIENKADIYRFKSLSAIHISIWVFINMYFIINNLKLFIISTSFGIMLEMFSIIPFGYKFFESIDKIDKRGYN